MTPKADYSFSYAVFSFETDAARALAVPVGVALWSPEKRWVNVRLVREKERLAGFEADHHLPFVRLVEEKIQRWQQTGKLPYQDAPIPPFDDRWWRHVRELLVHQIRLSEPRPIDCREPETEIEVLYESVVGPHRPPSESRARVDGVITKCLNGLADKFKGRSPVEGFGGRPVRVQRAFSGKRGTVVLEGVNLAGSNAEKDVDATASRLQRVREGTKGKSRFIIGYLASPEGLNGEAVLVDWLRKATEAQIFDLMKERDDLYAAAQESVDEMDEQQQLFKKPGRA